jgi:hypothetical protein
MDDLNDDPKLNTKPKRPRSFFVGAGVSFFVTYLVSLFVLLMKKERLADCVVGALVPSLILCLFGGFVGKIVATFPQPKHAVLIGGLLFGVFGAIAGPIIGSSPDVDSSNMILLVSAFAAIGAIVGATVAAGNANDRSQ